MTAQEHASLAAAALWQAGRDAWPAIAVPAEAFALHLESHADANPAHAADLYLACGCAAGDGAALSELDRLLQVEVDRVVARRGGPDLRDEIKQRLREKLLVGRDARPGRIQAYSGRGPLVNFVRVAALREAIEAERRKVRADPAPDALDRLRAHVTPADAALVRARAQPKFAAALESALAHLTPRQRNLLRMHHFKGVGVERLGVMYGVHASTVSRWLSAARAEVLAQARATIERELKLSPATWDSLLRDVRSDLHLSLDRLLQTSETGRKAE